MKTQHTPTPWEKHTEESNGGAKYWEIRGREPMPGNQNFVTSLWSEASADLIVRAVNSHNALIAALECLIDNFPAHDAISIARLMQSARATLAKAKGAA